MKKEQLKELLNRKLTERMYLVKDWADMDDYVLLRSDSMQRRDELFNYLEGTSIFRVSFVGAKSLQVELMWNETEAK